MLKIPATGAVTLQDNDTKIRNQSVYNHDSQSGAFLSESMEVLNMSNREIHDFGTQAGRLIFVSVVFNQLMMLQYQASAFYLALFNAL